MNGTPTALTIYSCKANVLIPKGNYILNGCPSGGSTTTYQLDMYVTGGSSFVDYGNGVNVSLAEDTTFTVVGRIAIRSGYTANHLKFYPMIRKASITDATYEPYVGGIASPNPDYPQEIEVAGASGSVVVKSVGKNLLKNTATSRTVEGVDFIVNEDKSIAVKGTSNAYIATPIADYVELPVGKELIMTGCPINGGGDSYQIYIAQYDSADKITRAYDYGSGCTFTIDKSTVRVGVYIWLKSGLSFDLTFYPMIRLASDTDDTYEPYTETTATISTPDGIAGINGVYDEVVKYADGSGKRIQRFAKIKLLSTWGWFVQVNSAVGSNGIGCFQAIPNLEVCANANEYAVTNMLCTHFQIRTSVSIYTNTNSVENSISAHKNASGTVIRLRNTNCTTLEEFKKFLDENEVYVMYEVETPVITDLTAEEIAEIEKLHTFYPVTNISNDADCGMAVTYLADSKNYIDNQLAIQAQAQEEALLNMLLLMPDSVQASMIENDTNNLLNEAEV